MNPTEVRGAAAPAGLLRRNGAYLAAFLMDGTLAFATIGSTYLAARKFDAGPAGLGLLNLVTAGSYVVFCLLLGPLSDRLGRRRLIIFGAVCDAAGLVLASGAGSFWELCLAMTLFSAGQGAYWPALEADIADHSSALELPRRLGKFNAAWCLGFVVGWPLGGVVGQSLDPRIVLLLGALVALSTQAAYLVRVFAPEPVEGAEPDECARERAEHRAVPFWTIALVLNFAAMGLSNSVRSQVAEVTGGDRMALGGLYGALFFGCQVAVFVLLALWRGWHYRAAPLVVGSLVGFAGAALCGLSPKEMFFAAGCMLSGLGCGVAYYSSIYYSVAAASARGHRGGIHEAVLGAGGAVVPTIGGLLAAAPWAGQLIKWAPEKQWTKGIPFLFAGAVLVLAFAAAMLVYARLRRGASESDGRSSPDGR
jgi:MFS family permease